MSEDPPEYQTKDMCKEKHKRVDEKMDCYESDIQSIKRSITATLVFTIITLTTFIIWLAQTTLGG